MLLAALLAFCASDPSLPWLGDAFLASDEIEIARVEASERIEGIPDASIVTLRIERSIWTSGCTEVRTVLVHDDWDASPRPLRLEDRSVWFLVGFASTVDEWDESARVDLLHRKVDRRYENVVCRLPIEVIDDVTRVSLPNQDWKPLNRALGDDPRQLIDLGQFEGLLWKNVRASTPCIEVRGEFTISSNGVVSTSYGRKPSGVVLAPWELSWLLSTIDRERFFDLPRAIGKDDGPDMPGRLLAVRTCEGRHEVVFVGRPDRRSAADVDACGRIERIWDAIPRCVWDHPGR